MTVRRPVVSTVLTFLVVCCMLVAAAASAGAIGATATHWGSFFGGDVHDKLLSPTAIKLPGRVVEVASSNSDEYALLADGAVYAWGLGGEGELGNGGTLTR